MDHKYKVYKVLHSVNGDDKIIYIGRTDNLKRRTYQHNYHFNKGKENQLYNYCRENGITEIELIPIYSYKSKVESKRMEMYLILQSYFSDNYTLQQKIPNVSDR